MPADSDRSSTAVGGRVVDGESLAIAARMTGNGAVEAECVALTGSSPDDDGIATGARVDRIDRAAYVHHGVRVIAAAPSFDKLIERVRDAATVGFDAEGFRVDVHDPAGRLPISSNRAAVRLADVMPYWPDLKAPQHRFLVVAGADRLVFGEVVASADAGYRRHDDKPWTTSSSLDSRLSRALINLVPEARSILDPCCGAGSIVLEAAALGLEAHGVDWKPALAGMTRENLAHYGYDATVTQADSRTHECYVDAIVTDLPYGHAIDSDEHVIRAILAQSATLAPAAVFVAPADISAWLEQAGYTNVEIHTVMKRRGFTRWIHVAQRMART